MTVEELIEKLKLFDKDLEVRISTVEYVKTDYGYRGDTAESKELYSLTIDADNDAVIITGDNGYEPLMWWNSGCSL